MTTTGWTREIGRGERRREGEEVRERARARSPVAVVGKAAADRWCASDRGHLARCFFLFPPVEETQEKLGNKKKWEETSFIPTRSSSLLYRVERNKKYKKPWHFLLLLLLLLLLLRPLLLLIVKSSRRAPWWRRRPSPSVPPVRRRNTFNKIVGSWHKTNLDQPTTFLSLLTSTSTCFIESIIIFLIRIRRRRRRILEQDFEKKILKMT